LALVPVLALLATVAVGAIWRPGARRWLIGAIASGGLVTLARAGLVLWPNRDAVAVVVTQIYPQLGLPSSLRLRSWAASGRPTSGGAARSAAVSSRRARLLRLWQGLHYSRCRGGWRGGTCSGWSRTKRAATDREITVVAAVIAAGSEKAAAHRLGLSHSTVKDHLANGRSRVGATTTAQLVWILALRLPEPETGGQADE
jgi:DNA-binding CsgD family transcriptional regulator